MRISKKLSMILPVDLEDGSTVYVHSNPVAYETFETYVDTLGKVFTTIIAKGIGNVMAPRLSYMLLKEEAIRMGAWDGERGIRRGFLEEVWRLTNVVVPGARGWEPIPYEDAKKSDLFDDSDVSEIENAIVYFILASGIHKRSQLKPILLATLTYWGGRPELLSVTEFITSLGISTTGENTGVKVKASSIPS